MTVDFKIHIDGLDKLPQRFVRTCAKAETTLANQVMKDTRPYVPMLNVSLDKRTHVVDDKIIYPGPYARFLYYGKVMVDPDTGSPYAKYKATKVVTDRNLVFTTQAHANAQAHWFEASKAQNLDKWLRVAEKAVKDFE